MKRRLLSHVNTYHLKDQISDWGVGAWSPLEPPLKRTLPVHNFRCYRRLYLIRSVMLRYVYTHAERCGRRALDAMT